MLGSEEQEHCERQAVRGCRRGRPWAASSRSRVRAHGAQTAALPERKRALWLERQLGQQEGD